MNTPDRLSAHIRSNAIKSALLIAGFPFVIPGVVFVFLLLAGMMFGQRNAVAAAGQGVFVVLVVMLVVTLVWLPIGYLMNQWIIDRATGARMLGRHEEPRLWALLTSVHLGSERRGCGSRRTQLNGDSSGEISIGGNRFGHSQGAPDLNDFARERGERLRRGLSCRVSAPGPRRRDGEMGRAQPR